ncbi:X-ray repair cross-complementing protein 6 [Actinomortierella ambigua]|uniref:ATP-dependent DNA helicase II subunit 1 n=1 Tax=Actinomortierella ambigua TaxID=1343610 RepID=A0A9P6QL00_9FUNG|nr:X-ray repair cross-complementing protein 6 [Actinomortierella ambigua]
MSSSWRSQNDYLAEDEDEDVLTDEAETQLQNRDSILFVIDSSPAMHEVNEDGESPFKMAIKCAKSVQMNKIISSESDLVGIMVYGVEKTKNANNFENICVLQDLDIPDASGIKQLEALEEGTLDFEDMFGKATGKYKLSEVFWTATNIFSSSAQKVGSRRLFLITNEDNPHGNEPTLQGAAKLRAKDLSEPGISIELFDLDRKMHRFDRSLFYKSILVDSGLGRSGDDDDDEDNGDGGIMDDEEAAGAGAIGTGGGSLNKSQSNAEMSSTVAKMSALLERVHRKEVKKRSLFKIPFKLAPGLEIGVRGYNLIMQQGKGLHRNVYTKGEVVREVMTTTSWICADSKQFLLQSDLKFFWEFGGAKVVFTKDEIKAMKTFGPPGLALLGFKPRSAIPMSLQIQHAVFLYPDERQVEGSTRAFSALLSTMADLDRVAICSLTQRTNYSTRLVALFPQVEITGPNGQEHPPGFQLIPLPWRDDLRPLHVEIEYSPPEEVTNACKAIISKLNVKKGYRPENYENPALQKHYKVLQATALDQQDQEIDDQTLPHTEQIYQRAGALIEHMNQVVDEQDLTELMPHVAVVGQKRGAGAATQDDEVEGGGGGSSGRGGGGRKRARGASSAGDGEGGDDGNGEDAAALLAEMRAKYDAGQVSKATVAVLKAFLNSVNVKPQGSRKAELVDQVENYFAN